MGTGKTVISELLAHQLGWARLDTDDLIATQTETPIAQIFAEYGEAHFRKLESEILQGLQTLTKHVISTGGGIILKPENRQLLKKLGKVILLQATPQTIIERLQEDLSRPLLQGTNSEKLEKIVQLLEFREPLYRECADFTIDTTALEPNQIAKEILKFAKTNRD